MVDTLVTSDHEKRLRSLAPSPDINDGHNDN